MKQFAVIYIETQSRDEGCLLGSSIHVVVELLWSSPSFLSGSFMLL